MNKDVVYIESEDDITDILSKLTHSEQKVVALVPPKKAGVLRSAVNIKLIAKSAKAADKAAVLVTSDPTLIRLAAAARIPVAKTLQSRPEIPEMGAEDANPADEQVIEEDLSAEEPSDATSGKKAATDAKNGQKSQKDAEKPAEKAEKPEKTPENPEKSDKKDKSKKVPDIKRQRKFIIAGIIAGVLIIGFAVWAAVFAPAVTISVDVKTTSNNFSEPVTLTTKDAAVDVTAGIFLVEEKKVEQSAQVEFTATGKKDIGNKASGELSVTHAFKNPGETFEVPSGATFTYDGKKYIVSAKTTWSWQGSDGDCESGSTIAKGCFKSTKVNVIAAEPGEGYNIGSHTSGWSVSIHGLSNIVNSPISGGSTNIVTVVQQSDVDAAMQSLASASESDGKAKLYEEVGKDNISIDTSYAVSTPSIASNPAVGEEVKSGVKPTLSSTTTYSVFVVDKANVEDFIKSKVTLADDQKIYSLGNPYFERFTSTSNGLYSAKLKTSYRTGPKVSNEAILDKVKGKKTGEVQSLLKSINGVSNVNIETSFFWVSYVPDDPNKITINITNESENEDK